MPSNYAHAGHPPPSEASKTCKKGEKAVIARNGTDAQWQAFIGDEDSQVIKDESEDAVVDAATEKLRSAQEDGRAVNSPLRAIVQGKNMVT